MKFAILSLKTRPGKVPGGFFFYNPLLFSGFTVVLHFVGVKNALLPQPLRTAYSTKS
jgi:hypothetical protein